MRFLLAAAPLVFLAACATTPAAPVLEKGTVRAKLETPPVAAALADDAADDPAIWVAADPRNSRVVATQKKGGLYVYDLNAQLVQEIPGGLPNNVDLRDGFAFADGTGAVVGASDRTDQTIVLWKLDPDTGKIDPTPRARIKTGFAEVYGFCLGRMGVDTYAIATGKTGELGIWRLRLDYDLKPEGVPVKKLKLASITEGCVVDDDNRMLYVSEELVGVWKISLDPDDATTPPTLLDRVAPAGNLAADVEGITLWTAPSGKGYIIVSAQGENRFAVYDRDIGTYRGSVKIGASADGKVDGVSGTDGLDVTSMPLGPEFLRGLMVVQDDENTDPVAPQNFKYVSWADVEAALGIEAGPPQ